MDEKKKPTREEIVRSLRICSTAIMEGCGGCMLESETTGTLGEMCGDALRTVAADLIDEMTDRCARYAEEIMELRQVNDLSGASRHLPLKGEARAVEDASPYEAGTDRAV